MDNRNRVGTLLVALVLFGCPVRLAGDRDAGTADDGGRTPDSGHTPVVLPDGGDGGLVDVTGFAPGCNGMPSTCAEFDAGTNCGECQYRLRYDASRCSPATPCDNLLLVWAAMKCDSDEWLTVEDALEGRSGWMTACVQPAWPGEVLPTTIGAPQRDTAVMSALLGEARGPWSGKNLLMVGCSAGATRYPLVAARTDADDAWTGSIKTGVCMSDGVYNVPHQESFIGQGLLDGGESCAFRHRRIALGFTSESPTPGHSCSGNSSCACNPAHSVRTRPGACGGGDCVEYESIVVPAAGGALTFAPGVGASSFAVRHWRLVSEGASFTREACAKDVVAGAPVLGLCAAIDSGPDHECSPVEFPNAPHCAGYWNSLETTCVDWFDGL
ncbi:MAG: hypothetical protein RL653_1867 [Pseudomonadota bacterium]|jgi:hypothetical protein